VLGDRPKEVVGGNTTVAGKHHRLQHPQERMNVLDYSGAVLKLTNHYIEDFSLALPPIFELHFVVSQLLPANVC